VSGHSDKVKRVLAVCSDREYARPYEEALRYAGVEPVIVSPEEQVSLDEVSGLMLMGGTDVNPARYGQARQSETDAPDDPRDQKELSLIAEALKRDLPILAICRGMQILNVQHGGTLIQHMEGHQVRTPEDKGRPVHQVAIEPDTILARIAEGAGRWDVNSRHHQAIATLGDGLIIAGKDPRDGVIEAIERPDRRFVVAVQWHPENQFAAKVEEAKLFDAFAASL
jgi:putative glutamine amidotransferase